MIHHTGRVYAVGKQAAASSTGDLPVASLYEDVAAPNVRLQKEKDGEFAD